MMTWVLEKINGLVWLIRDVEVILHIIAGSLAIISFVVSGVLKKGSPKHVLSGKVYGFSLIGLLLTSFIAFFMIGEFPFFLMAFMAFYLHYSSKVKIFGEHTKFDWVMLLSGLLVAVFYIFIGSYLRHVEGNDRMYPYSIWGIGFLFFVVWDIVRVYQGRANLILNKWMLQHLVRSVGSFYFVITAFMVSQFSHLPPQNVLVLCWFVPIILTSLILLTFLIVYRRYLKRQSLVE